MDTIFETVIQGSHLFGQNPFAMFMIALPLSLMVLLLLTVTYLRIQTRKKGQALQGILKEIESTSHELPPDLASPPNLASPPDHASPPAAAAALEASSEEEPRHQATTSLDLKEKLKGALRKSQKNFSEKIHQLLGGKDALDSKTLQELKSLLYRSDLGPQICEDLLAFLEEKLKKPTVPITQELISSLLSEKLLSYLSQTSLPPPTPQSPPEVIMMVGVNGVGKTTTTAKIAALLKDSHKKVLLCAADTFRAGATDQLRSWGERVQVDVVYKKPGSDPAAVVYEAIQKALKDKADTVIIDTAGRLHNREDLMNQLGKILRVMQKLIVHAPHHIWLVIDATTGQNAMQQVESFKEMVGVNGLIVTKLDGTAKGGALIGISHKFKLPVRYIGVGEKMDDLKAFEPALFVETLLSSETQEKPSP